MQVCRFYQPGSGPCVGVVHAGRIHDLTRAGLCDSIRSFLNHPDPLRLARTAVETVPAGAPLERLDQPPRPELPHLLAPIDRQEVWASGVTYIPSRDARVREAVDSDFYTRVYQADRPELFLKSTPHRTAGPNAAITIRADSHWNVPEAELTVALSADLHIVGYTVGNDVSSRSIEGENPLYLPQAKIWVGSCALGPVITLAEPGTVDLPTMAIHLTVWRDGQPVVEGRTSTAEMKRRVAELVSYLGRANAFPDGAFLLTGTGIVPPDDFTLQPGDVVDVEISGIGHLRNTVERSRG